MFWRHGETRLRTRCGQLAYFLLLNTGAVSNTYAQAPSPIAMRQVWARPIADATLPSMVAIGDDGRAAFVVAGEIHLFNSVGEFTDVLRGDTPVVGICIRSDGLRVLYADGMQRTLTLEAGTIDDHAKLALPT